MANWVHTIETLGRVRTVIITEEGTNRPLVKVVVDTPQNFGFIIPYETCTYGEARLLRKGFKEKGTRVILLSAEGFKDFLAKKVDDLSPIFEMAAKHVLDNRTAG